MKRTGNAANPARFRRPLHFVVEKFVVEKHVACRTENGALMPRDEATGAVAIASDRTFPARRAAWSPPGPREARPDGRLRRNPPSWRFMTADHDPPYELAAELAADCGRCSPVPHLPSKSDGKDRANGRAGRERKR